MKRNNQKRGFTIIELVIVIAVIAILAAVLIPTFSGVVEKAKQSAALQEVKNTYTQVQLTLSIAGLTLDEKAYFSDKDGEYFFKVNGGSIEKMDKPESTLPGYATLEGGVRLYGVSITKTTTTNSSNDKVILFAEPVKGASECTLTVYDFDGNQYYKEHVVATSSTGNNTTVAAFTTGIYFAMWNTSKNATTQTTWDKAASVSTAALNNMTEESAYGWYSYVLEYTSNNPTTTFTGVFYYGA